MRRLTSLDGMLSVLLLGPPQLLLDGQPLDVTRRKSRALIYYLAGHPAPTTRDHLLDLFWPDLDRPAAQQVLRTTLHGLRKSLGVALAVADDALALAPETLVDVWRFAAQLAAPAPDPSSLTAALALYRGDFLNGFSLPDSPSFDNWVAGEQERYRQMAVRGFATLAQLHEARQDFPAALHALNQALDFDPLQEDLQRAAMRLNYLAGDRVGAIRRYEQLRALLDEELGVPPMAETQALYDSIITDSLERDTVTRWQSDRVTENPQRTATIHAAQSRLFLVPPSDTLPFIGRAVELERLRSLATTHKLLLIEGEPGIGKTRLAEEFIGDSGTVALVGVARELEHSLPYQPVIDALRGLVAHPLWPDLQANLDLPAVWMAEVARLLPELAGQLSDPQRIARAPDESRLWEGVHQLLLALARQHPLVLLLDDLHWADASTLALLGYLVRQADTMPIIFLATVRSATPRTPLAALLQTLTHEGRLARLDLARLTPDEVMALARRLSPASAEHLADWLLHSSEGNPYILAELVRHLREHHLLNTDGALHTDLVAAGPVVPPTVYSLIQSRLDQLSDVARRVLDVAVAAGREFEFELVARAAALSEQAVLDALDELRAARLLHPLDGLRYAFDHSLTMEVAYREVGEPRHRLMHRRLAEALESLHRNDTDPVAGLIASHFAEGNAPERGATYAFRAGQLAAELAAWSEAIAFYKQALMGTDIGQQARIQMALGEVLLRSGEAVQASEAFRAVLALAPEQGDAGETNEARLELARALIPQVRFGEVIALAQQVLASDSRELAAHAEFLWGAALSLEGADLAGAAEHLKRSELLLQQQVVPASSIGLAQVRFELGSIAAQQGDLEEAVALYQEALATAQDLSCEATLSWRILSYNNLAYHLHLLGDPSAIEYARAGLQLAQEEGVIGMQAFLRSTMGEIALVAGDLATAEQQFSEGLALAERLAMPERIAGLTANLGLVALHRNQPALAIHRLSTALARADALGTRHLAARIRIWLVPLLPPAEARAALAEARSLAESGNRKLLLAEIARLENAVERSGF